MFYQDFRRLALARTLPVRPPRAGPADTAAEPRPAARPEPSDDRTPAARD